MRRAMSCLVPVAAAAAASLCLLTAPTMAPAQERSAASANALDLTVMGEQIEIMRLVLTRSVNDRFAEMLKKAADDAEQARRKAEAKSDDHAGQQADMPDMAPEAAPDTTESAVARALAEASESYRTYYSHDGWSSGLPTLSNFYGSAYTSHTRGFYTPGFGVFFTTEVSTPTIMIIETPDSTTQVKPDAWDQAARAVQRGDGGYTDLFPRSDKPKTVRRWEIADDYVNAAVETIISAVRDYGMRLDQLPENESIAVGLRFEPGLTLPVMTDDTTAVPAPADVLATDALRTYVVSSMGTVQQAKIRHVVIQIAKSDLQRLQTGQLDRETLRDHVTITEY